MSISEKEYAHVHPASNSRSYSRHLPVQEAILSVFTIQNSSPIRTSPSCPLQPVSTLPEFQLPWHYDFPDSCQCKTKLSLAGLLINVIGYCFQVLWISKGFTSNWTIRGWVASTVTGIILSQYAKSPWLKIIFLMVANVVTSLILCLIFLKAEIQDWANEEKHISLKV